MKALLNFILLRSYQYPFKITDAKIPLGKLNKCTDMTVHFASPDDSSIAGIDLETRAAGLLMEKEVMFFTKLLDQPVKPFVVILGGCVNSFQIDYFVNLCIYMASLVRQRIEENAVMANIAIISCHQSIKLIS